MLFGFQRAAGGIIPPALGAVSLVKLLSLPLLHPDSAALTGKPAEITELILPKLTDLSRNHIFKYLTVQGEIRSLARARDHIARFIRRGIHESLPGRDQRLHPYVFCSQQQSQQQQRYLLISKRRAPAPRSFLTILQRIMTKHHKEKSDEHGNFPDSGEIANFLGKKQKNCFMTGAVQADVTSGGFAGCCFDLFRIMRSFRSERRSVC